MSHTQPPPPDPAPSRERVVDAWAARPQAEVAAFLESLRPPAASDRDLVADPVAAQRIRAVAALSGRVRPTRLVTGVDPDRGRRLLASVSSEFDRSVIDGQMTWSLRSAFRTATLRQLRAEPLLLADSLHAADRVDTDAAGRVLRRIASSPEHLRAELARGGLPEAMIGDATLADVSQAILWAAELGDYTAGLAVARRRADVEHILESYQVLLRHGIVGRDADRRILADFLDQPVAGPPVPVLTLTGIGGAGKSTLLADVISPRLRAVLAGTPGAALVVIDLDRLAFRPQTDTELSVEVVRQLEACWPELAGDLAAIRSEENASRAERREYSTGQRTIETSYRATELLEQRVGDVVRASPRHAEPVALVLDTFEEWQRSRPSPSPRGAWNDPELAMAEWLHRLRGLVGLQGLRIVISGRAPVQAMPGEHHDLRDLTPAASPQLLTRLGVDPAFAPRLAEVVGGNPLSLHVAARFVGRLSKRERAAFIEEGALGDLADDLDEDLRRAVLYDRFLDHIDDPDVKRLAHPGLVLRRVVPELVRDVLAEPCGFVDMDLDRATSLVDRLSDEVWLVRPAEDGSLRHQPDVRRAMLSMMSHDRTVAETVREIHARAAAWYNPRPDVNDPPTPANVEAFYHRMMLSAGDQPLIEGDWNAHGRPLAERNNLAAFAQELGEGVADMHPAVAAQLRLLRHEPLDEATAALLPDNLWLRHVDIMGSAQVEDDDSESALDLYLTRPWPDNLAKPAWLDRAYCETARWTSYADAAVHDSSLGRGRFGLINLVAGAAGPSALPPLDAARETPIDDDDLVTTFLTALTSAARHPGGPEVEPPDGKALRRPVSPAYPVDQLRTHVAQRLIPDRLRPRGELQEIDDVAGLFVPDPAVLSSLANLLIGGDRALLIVIRDLGHLASRQQAATPAAPGLRSVEILGKQAQQFAGRLGPRQRFVATELEATHLLALRGDNPELRPAIRRELQRAAPDASWLRTLGEIATAILPIPASDLRPDALPLTSEVGSRAAWVTLVEYVDRSRRTREFLEAAAQVHPTPDRLATVVDGFTRWDDAHTRLFASLVDPEQHDDRPRSSASS